MKRVDNSSFFKGFVQFLDSFLIDHFFVSHDIPTDQNILFIVVHVVLSFSQSESFILYHEFDDLGGFIFDGGERDCESEFVRKFFLKGIKESVGDADVGGYIFGVVGGHAD